MIILASGLVSCGSEPIEPAEFGEVCGVKGPVRLVALEPDQVVRGGLYGFEERVLYTTAHAHIEADVVTYSDTVLWSTGPCGESPRRIADDVINVFTDDRWPGVLLGCRTELRDIVSIDPSGDEPPHVVYADVDCFSRNTPQGLVSIDAEGDGPAALTLHPHPDDARTETSEPVGLLDPDVTPEYPITAKSRVRARGDLVFVLTTDGTLLRIELPSGAATVEQTEVREFDISKDGRYLLWQRAERTDQDSEFPEGLVLLRDRESGDDVPLTTTWLDPFDSPLAWVELGLVPLMLSGGPLRIYFLPTLGFLEVYDNVYPLEQLADGRWLLQRWWRGPIYLGDLREGGSATPVFHNGAIVGREPDGLMLLEVPPDSTPGPLLFAPFDGSPPSRLADRVTPYYRLTEGRVLSAINVDDDGLGDFILADFETREERLIDRQVVDTSVWSTWDLGDDIVRYAVVDGERSGVWMVRLPSAP